MPAPPRAYPLLDQNAEYAARLKVSEESLRQLREAHEQLQAQHRQTLERKGLLEEEVRWLKGQLYGRSSERLSDSAASPDQRMLFNEAEVLAAIEAAEAAEQQRTTLIAAHERKARPHSGGREPIPAHLPRKEILHDPPAHQRWCTHEHEGVCWVRERIGEEVSERYHFEPAKVWIERHVYPKYACGHCHQGVTVAAAIKNILPKSNASASLLAHVVTSKFDDGLPIFRVCRQLERQEVRLTPGTVGTWVNTVGSETVMPLINLMNDDLLAEPVLQMDESVPRTRGRGALRCCGEDEGRVPRGRLSEGDLKPPTAAVSKRHGGERVGKAAARPRQVRIKEMSVSKPLVDVSKIARRCRNQCHFVPLG